MTTTVTTQIYLSVCYVSFVFVIVVFPPLQRRPRATASFYDTSGNSLSKLPPRIFARASVLAPAKSSAASCDS